MNKMITTKQLELTARKTRAELLLDTAPHIDSESSAFKAEMAKAEQEAAKAVLGSGCALREQVAEDDFDWNTDDAVILREQRATAVYHNRLGELIIRQQARWNDECDTFVYVTPENVTA